MDDPALDAARRAWDRFLTTPGEKILGANEAMDVSIDASREALKPIRSWCEKSRLALSTQNPEDALAQLSLAFEELDCLIYTDEELGNV